MNDADRGRLDPPMEPAASQKHGRGLPFSGVLSFNQLLAEAEALKGQQQSLVEPHAVSPRQVPSPIAAPAPGSAPVLSSVVTETDPRFFEFTRQLRQSFPNATTLALTPHGLTSSVGEPASITKTLDPARDGLELLKSVAPEGTQLAFGVLMLGTDSALMIDAYRRVARKFGDPTASLATRAVAGGQLAVAFVGVAGDIADIGSWIVPSIRSAVPVASGVKTILAFVVKGGEIVQTVVAED
jgi:hypothetical protein